MLFSFLFLLSSFFFPFSLFPFSPFSFISHSFLACLLSFFFPVWYIYLCIYLSVLYFLVSFIFCVEWSKSFIIVEAFFFRFSLSVFRFSIQVRRNMFPSSQLVNAESGDVGNAQADEGENEESTTAALPFTFCFDARSTGEINNPRDWMTKHVVSLDRTENPFGPLPDVEIGNPRYFVRGRDVCKFSVSPVLKCKEDRGTRSLWEGKITVEEFRLVIQRQIGPHHKDDNFVHIGAGVVPPGVICGGSVSIHVPKEEYLECFREIATSDAGSLEYLRDDLVFLGYNADCEEGARFVSRMHCERNPHIHGKDVRLLSRCLRFSIGWLTSRVVREHVFFKLGGGKNLNQTLLFESVSLDIVFL